MNLYGSLADDMYMNVNLATEMELPGHRETVLHFFECVRKKFPTMRKCGDVCLAKYDTVKSLVLSLPLLSSLW